jgi:hypothetical protein
MVVHQPNDPRPQHIVSLFDIATGNTGQKQSKRRKDNLRAYHEMIRAEEKRRARGEPPQYKLPFRAFIWKDGKKTAVSIAEYNKAQTDPSRRVKEALFFRPPEYYNPKTGTYVESDDIRHDWETWYRVHRPTAQQKEEAREAKGGKPKDKWNAGDWTKAIAVGMFRGLVDPLGSVENIGQGDWLEENQAYTADEFGADVLLTVGLLGAGQVAGKTMKNELTALRKEMGVTFDSHLRYRNVQRLQKAMKNHADNMASTRAQAAIIERDALENADERYVRQRAALEQDRKNATQALKARIQREKMPPKRVMEQIDLITGLYKNRITHIQRSYQRNLIATRAEIRLASYQESLRAGAITLEDYDVLTRKLERERISVSKRFAGDARQDIQGGEASMPDFPSGRTEENDLLHNYDKVYEDARKGIEETLALRRAERLARMTPEERVAHRRTYAHQSALLEDEADKIAFDFAYDVYAKPDARRKNLHGYVYNPTLSGDNIGVWYNPELKRVHVAHRGSVDLFADWLGADVQILLGGEGVFSRDRFNRSLRKVREAHAYYAQQYGDVTVDQSGHSLGAGVGQYVMGKDGTQSWMGTTTTFNGGVSPASTARLFLSKSAEERAILNKKMVNIRQTNDPVSGARAPFGQTKNYYSTMRIGMAHSMDSFNLRGVRVTGSVETLKEAAKNPAARLFTQLSGAQLRRIAKRKNKTELTVEDLLNITQKDVDAMDDFTAKELTQLDTLVHNKEFAEHTDQPEEVTDEPITDIGAGGFVHRSDVYGEPSTGAEDVHTLSATDTHAETHEPTKETPASAGAGERQESLPIAIPVRNDVLPSATAIPIYDATPVYDKDGQIVLDSHAYEYHPEKEMGFDAQPVHAFSMEGDELTENAFTYGDVSAASYTGGSTGDDAYDTYTTQGSTQGGTGSTPHVLGYIVYPASQQQFYENAQVVFS